MYINFGQTERGGQKIKKIVDIIRVCSHRREVKNVCKQVYKNDVVRLTLQISAPEAMQMKRDVRVTFSDQIGVIGKKILYRACAHRKWKEIKQQLGTAGPGKMHGCCLVSSHFLWAVLCPEAVQGGWSVCRTGNGEKLSCSLAQLCLAAA